MTPSSADKQPDDAVTVPINEPADPFADPDHVEMTPLAAEHWDRRRWHQLDRH